MQSLRTRLACFFAALIAVVLLGFAGAVYLAAAVLEEREVEPQAEKDRELREVRRLLWLSLGMGIPLGAGLAVLGSAQMTRRTLRALADIVRSASELDPDRLGQRIPSQPHDDLEIRRLVAALNHMLERLDLAVTGLRRFTRDAAHELRTPLAVLMSRLEIALRQPRDSTALRTTMEDSLEELASLQRLVDALLLLARSDAGELLASRQPVVLLRLLSEIASLYEAIASEWQLTLHIDCDPALSLDTDKVLLGRAVANLLDNACKFSFPGGKVWLCATRQPNHGGVTITVADSGCGVPASEEEQVFARFYRCPNHRSPTPGFGLGLALTREFVTALCGTVTLRARSGGGTEVEICLPRRAQPLAYQDLTPA